MNIGIDIRCLMHPTKTGVGEYTQALLDALFILDKKNQYYLYYNSNKNISANLPKWDQGNVHIVSSHYPNKLLNLSIATIGYPKLDRLITKITHTKLDVFYSPNLNFTALSTDISHFITIHDLAFFHFPEYYTLIQKWWHRILRPISQCQKAKMIFAPSKNTKLDLSHSFNISPDKIQVIYPGLSPIFHKTSDLENKKTIVKKKYHLPNHFILFLGTIEPRKNVDGVISAFEKVYSQLPFPYYLIIAGAKGWKNEEIYKRADKSPYRDHIQFIGYVHDDEKPALYAEAGLFIYPSFYEGFGFPVLEALSMNTPVVTSQRSSLPEIANKYARLVDPNNIHSIGYGIIDALKSNPTVKKPNEDLKKYLEKFSWEFTARQFLETVTYEKK